LIPHWVDSVGEYFSSLLRPSPEALEKALKDSATQARRMADAFGLKVPGIAEKPAKAASRVVALRRKATA
jgi:uncharacterized protein YggE